MRVGIGYDVHQLTRGRRLVLGGVYIPYEKGLLGHSDADVLVHAICDALLGAAGMGDIGRHFPDTDERYDGISSMILLGTVGRMLDDAGYRVVNVDAVIVAQKPRLVPFITDIVQNLAKTLGIDSARINVKATTTEGLGFAGRGEGIAAQAVACIASISANQPSE